MAEFGDWPSYTVLSNAVFLHNCTIRSFMVFMPALHHIHCMTSL